MNPLTLVKRTQKINSTEAALGISEEASWHAIYKESAYVFVGGIPYDLTEGDLLAVFAQYGEVVDVNLVRDKSTGKSKGFAFLAYEDQRSTILAVDNLNGAKVLGRIVRVDHVSNYKKKEEEDAAEAQKKREERGVCRAFQRGDCTRGDSCKFSHDEHRTANRGWGPEDTDSRWNHDKHEAPAKNSRSFSHTNRNKPPPTKAEEDNLNVRSSERGGRPPRSSTREDYDSSQQQQSESVRKDHEGEGRRSDKDSERRLRMKPEEDDGYKRTGDKHSSRYEVDDSDRRETEKRSRHDREQEQQDHYRRTRR